MATKSTEDIPAAVAEPSTSQSLADQPDKIEEGKEDLSAINQLEIQNEPQFVGLGKEELLVLANRPFWVRLRWALFITFWLIWLGLLVGAALIIGLSPGCVDSDEPKIASASSHHR